MGEGGRPPGGRGSGTARRPRGCRSPVCSFLCFSREKRLSGPHRISPWPCVSCDQPELRGSHPALVRRGWRGLLDPLEGGPRPARGGSPRARRRRRGPGAGREWGGGGPCQEPPTPEPPRPAAALRVSDGTFLPVGQGSPPSRSKLEQSTLGCHCRGQGQSGSGHTGQTPGSCPGKEAWPWRGWCRRRGAVTPPRRARPRTRGPGGARPDLLAGPTCAHRVLALRALAGLCFSAGVRSRAPQTWGRRGDLGSGACDGRLAILSSRYIEKGRELSEAQGGKGVRRPPGVSALGGRREPGNPRVPERLFLPAGPRRSWPVAAGDPFCGRRLRGTRDRPDTALALDRPRLSSSVGVNSLLL